MYEESNAILRKFWEHIDYFVRVNFVDENLEQGFYVQRFARDLTNHIWNIVQFGITIGESNFFFVGYSTSQIRSHSMWMISESSADKFTSTNLRQYFNEDQFSLKADKGMK